MPTSRIDNTSRTAFPILFNPDQHGLSSIYQTVVTYVYFPFLSNRNLKGHPALSAYENTCAINSDFTSNCFEFMQLKFE